MLPARSYLRRLGPLLLLLAFPAVAHADALDGVMLMFELLAAVAGIALFGVVLTLLAYFRPQSRLLQVLNGIMLIISLLLGLTWGYLFSSSGSSVSVLREFNPFLSLAVPLAVWLGGVTLARREAQPMRRLVWVSMAVFGAQLLLIPMLQMVLRVILGTAFFMNSGLIWVWWAGSIVLGFGIWWMVLEQVQRRWLLEWHQPRLRMLAPAIAAGFSTSYSFLSIWMTMGPDLHIMDLGQFVVSLLGYGFLGWTIGVLAVWLNQNRYMTSAVPEKYQD